MSINASVFRYSEDFHTTVVDALDNHGWIHLANLPESFDHVQLWVDSKTVKVSIHYQPRDFLILDNWKVLHSRSAFEDSERWFKRVQIASIPQ